MIARSASAELRHMIQRFPKGRGSLFVIVDSDRLLSPMTEIGHRLLRALAAREMVGETVIDGVEPTGVKGFESLSDSRVNGQTARLDQRVICDGPDAVVGKVEALADAVKNASPDQFLHCLRGFPVSLACGAMQERECAAAPDNGRDLGQLSTFRLESLEPPRDQRPN